MGRGYHSSPLVPFKMRGAKFLPSPSQAPLPAPSHYFPTGAGTSPLVPFKMRGAKFLPSPSQARSLPRPITFSRDGYSFPLLSLNASERSWIRDIFTYTKRQKRGKKMFTFYHNRWKKYHHSRIMRKLFVCMTSALLINDLFFYSQFMKSTNIKYTKSFRYCTQSCW